LISRLCMISTQLTTPMTRLLPPPLQRCLTSACACRMQVALPPPPQGRLAAVPANKACARRGRCCRLHHRAASPQATAHPIAAVQPLPGTTQLPARWLPSSPLRGIELPAGVKLRVDPISHPSRK
jgi:hypothetical protein